jgi:hypothetical protein
MDEQQEGGCSLFTLMMILGIIGLIGLMATATMGAGL